MEQLTLLNAVRDETLSNDKAILELYERRDHYAACDLSQEHHAEIAHLFEVAVLDMQKAVAAHEPVVKVLKKVLLDLGSLLMAEKGASRVKSKFRASPKVGVATGEIQQEVEHESSARSSANMSQTQKSAITSRLRDPAVPSAEAKKIEPVSLLSRSLTASKAVDTAVITTVKHTEGKRDASKHTKALRLEQIQATLKARNPEWSQEKIQKTASDHLVLILSKQRANAEKTALSQVDGQGSDDARRLPPSRSMSPSDPFSSMRFARPSTNTKRAPRSPPKAPAPHRRKTPLKKKISVHKEGGKNYKSKEFVVDSDESGTKMKGSNTSAPPDVGVVDPSEGLAGFENLDKNGNYVKKPPARFVLVNGKPRIALVVKLKVSPEKLLNTLYGKKVKAERKQLGLNPSTNDSRTRQSRVESLPSTSDTPSTGGGFNASPFAPQPTTKMASDNEDADWESEPETTTAAMTATAPSPDVEFPSFPPLTAAHLPPFMKGLTIAIENIIQDHAKKPDDTLLKLVEELDGNKPTLPGGNIAGDDRHVVMSGGEYVYAAVRQAYADVTHTEDSPKDSGIDADGDTTMTSTSSNEVDADPVDDVKLYNHYDGITAIPEKAQYNGKGCAWEKTPDDADPPFRVVSKANVSKLPKRELSRRKAARGDQPGTWKEQGIRELFEAFHAHVKREYWLQAAHIGT
ncbi:uncharacterized protein CC84DRAFT_1255911 [Paraphaeosphaeria sporulosa]|uniref:Uncharacterized protein n=1 Tax=Paraphaeosphaeria sporulosa TaxID=1460663 RepID=A0A177CTC2_9PLEO|nr:uncharacterized protein CC84DRAFT_1255911 [Paraphaeosphaeria sporulosa]OAG09999.1 hypothetical protein CC84DRAFT_1255911 [Paraphaeosphaeria sporulosa]